MAERERRPGMGLPRGAVAALVFAVALVVLLVLIRGGGEPAANGASGREPAPGAAADGDIADLERRVAERLDPITLRPAGALRVRLGDVVWNDDRGRPFLASPAMTFAVRLGPAAGGEVLIHDGVIRGLEVNLVQAGPGQWNYERVLAPLLEGNGRREAAGGPGTPLVALRDIVLSDGAVRIQLPDALYRATDLQATLASAQLAGPGVPDPTFQVRRATALLHLPDTAGGSVERRVALEDARLLLQDGALAFRVEEGRFGGSSFAAAEGIWDPALGGLGLDAVLTVTDGRLADLPRLPGRVPEDARGSLRLRIEALAGDRTALTVTDAALTAPGSSVTGSLRAVLSASGVRLESVDARVDPLSLDLVETFTGPLPYSGDLTGTIRGTGGDIRFELAASLATSPTADRFHTDLTGRLAFTDAGAELRGLTAELDQVPLEALRQLAPGLPLAGPISGTVTLDGPPGESAIRLDTRLEAGGGVVTVAGTVDLRATPPRYDLQGRLIGVELRRVLEPAAPPAQVHARFALAGTGLDPATADATVALNGTFTGWESEPGDTLALAASVRGGLLRAQSARVALGPIQLAAEGEWRFAGGTGGAIRYDLEVASLEPLGPYLPPDAAGRRPFSRGRLSAEGTLSGTLEAPDLAGTVEARGFRVGEWAAESFDGEYDVRLGEGLPHIEARFSGRDLRSPGGDFEAADVTVNFTRPDFEFALRASQPGGGVVEIDAGGLIDDVGQREIVLRRAEVDLRDQRWTLPGVAEIAWTAGGAVRVTDFRMEQVEGDGLVRLEGVVAPFDATDFELEVRRLPVDDVLTLVGSELDASGVLTLDGRVTGPAASPFLDLEMALDDGSIRGVAVRRLSGALGYDDGRLRLDGIGLLGDSARIEIDGVAPARLALGLPPSIELVDGERLDVRVATEDFPLATLDPGIRTVTDIVGVVTADVRIGGTADAPVLAGRVALQDGALTLPLLDRRYTDIHGAASLDGRVLQVDSVVARSDGTARLTGQLVFDQLTNPALDLRARLDGFRPQGVESGDGAAAWGTLSLGGTVATPRLTGSLRLDDGTLSIAPLQEGAGFSDALVSVGDPLTALSAGREFDLRDPAAAGLRVAGLEIIADEDLWFATEEARAQLSGTLVVDKQGTDVMVQGTLEGEQGTFTLRVGPRITRRFDIVDAHIRFFGTPEPNPALDITASRLVRTADGGDVDVRIRVGGTLNSPTLSLASAQGSSLPESELFCFVALGRPCTEVTAFGGATALSDLFAIYGLTDLVVSELGVPLDLDYFQIQMRPGEGLGGGLYVTFGEEIDFRDPLDNLFLLGEIPIGPDIARYWETSLEWRIDRQWTLELSLEPTASIRNASSGRTLPEDMVEHGRQALFAIRRRWTY